MVLKECIIRQVDEREWQINCFGMETGKTMVKESWINGKYAFLFAKGYFCLTAGILTDLFFINVYWVVLHITDTSPYLFGNFRKLSLYNRFMPI